MVYSLVLMFFLRHKSMKLKVGTTIMGGVMYKHHSIPYIHSTVYHIMSVHDIPHVEITFKSQ